MAEGETTPRYSDLLRLDDRHVLVLGAGQGIGRQAAIALAQNGARVTCVDVDQLRAESVAAETGGTAVVADATVRADMERCFRETVSRLGHLDALVDVIGIGPLAPLDTVDDAAWGRTLDLNLRHALLALQIGSTHMPGGGSMVFVASVAGISSAPGRAAYGAAKAALINLVSSAAIELAPSIRVNAVAPGHILTPREVARLGHEPGFRQNLAKSVPLGRVGEPCDVACSLLYFVSDLSSWVTGRTLVVDGGVSRKYPYDF